MQQARKKLLSMLPKALEVFDAHMDHIDPKVAQSAAKEILQRAGLANAEEDSAITVRFDAAMRGKSVPKKKSEAHP